MVLTPDVRALAAQGYQIGVASDMFETFFNVGKALRSPAMED